MIEITVNGDTKGFYTEDTLEIGSRRISDVRLAWIAGRHMTLHLKETHFSVELHSDESFEYGGYYLYRENGREDIQYGKTFKIGYNFKPGCEDARCDRDYTIRVIKRS